MNRAEYETLRRNLRARGQMGRWELTARFAGPNAFPPAFKLRHERIRDLSRLCRWRRRSVEAMAALEAAGADSWTMERCRQSLECGTMTPQSVMFVAGRLAFKEVPSHDETDARSRFIVYGDWLAKQRKVAA